MRTKNQTAFFLLMMIMIFCTPSVTTADDNEIFGVVQQNLEPNILLIIDNSGSMSSEVEVPSPCGPVTYKINKNDTCNGTKFKKNGQWYCTEERCYTVKTRIEVVKQVANDIIDKYGETNRFGIMKFHDNAPDGIGGGYIPSLNGRYATCSVKDFFILDSNGVLKTGTDYDTAITNYKIFLKSIVNALKAETWTPLAETLFEAGRYFAGEASVFNTSSSYYPPNGNYPDKEAIGYRCRKNYIVLLTDGEPTHDRSLRGLSINGNTLPASGHYTGTNSTYFYRTSDPELQDVAGLLFDNDINEFFDETDYKQNIITYTIGFSEGVTKEARLMLQDTADRGSGLPDTPYVNDGGLFFYATNPQDLAQAFETIMFNISEKVSTFAAPTVPVSDINKAYAGDYAYMAMFQPQSGSSRWIGNLKKYYLNDNLEFASCDDHTPILQEDGKVKDTANSCWSDIKDGGAVNKGGAGQILSDTDDSARQIYSNVSGADLTTAQNAFSTTNAGLTPGAFGLASDAAKNTLINKIRMVDEEWKLGDLNHSRPGIASYGLGNAATRYIFVGSNDGMLHCFDDADGSETWAFVPSAQFLRLEEVYTGDHSYFMDGSPTIADSTKKKIVICGERRGGNNYYAIDISTIKSPKYLYTVTTPGQSWKQPQFMRMASGANSSADVFLLTGGYDTVYDSGDSPVNPKGNSLICVNAESGTEFVRFDNSTIAVMKHSIVSAVGADMVDDGKDIVSQIYAGDLGGQLFAFCDNNDPELTNNLDGDWKAIHLFSVSSTGKKIFNEVDFSPEFMRYYDTTTRAWKQVVGDYVFFGTGDRAHPLRTDEVNYFYCIKNDWQTEKITAGKKVKDFDTLNDPNISDDNEEYVLLDVTDNKIQDGTAAEKKEAQNALNQNYNRGWYIKLEGTGEKCLSSPVVYDGVVYFTTFTPSENYVVNDDPCLNPSSGGTARLYAVNYKTGAAVYRNFSNYPADLLNKEDRTKEINAEDIMIAPDPLMIISHKGEKLSIGATTENVRSKKGVNLFYWMQQ